MATNPSEFQSVGNDFRGGVVTKTAAYLLLDNQLTKAQDAILHRGGISKNSGHSGALSSVAVGTKGLSIFRAYSLRSGHFSIAQFANSKLYRASGTRLTAIGSGMCTSTKLFYAVANGKVYMSPWSSATAVKGWSGNKANAVFNPANQPPEAATMVYYHQDANRLFIGNGPTNPQRVWYTDINSFETWPANNFFDIPESRTGDSVTGFNRLLGRLVIFGEKTISILYGRTPSDFILRTLEWTRGTSFPHTIVGFDSYIVYLGNDGIYTFDGSGSAKKISDPIETTIINDINKSRTSNTAFDIPYGPAAMRSREGHYVLSYKSASANTSANALNNDREIVCIPPSAEVPYWHFQGPNKRGFSYYARFSGTVVDLDQTYGVSGDTTGQIYKLEAGQTYATSGIDMQVETKEYDLGSPFTRKEFLQYEIHVETQGDYYLQVQYKIDHETNWRDLENISLKRDGPVYGTVDIEEGPRGRICHRGSFDATQNPIGNYIQFRFRSKGENSKNQPVNILGFVVSAREWRNK